MLRTDANTYDTFYLENSLSYLNEKDEETNIDKSVDGKPVSDEIIKNSKLKGVIGKIGGIGADSNEPTRNGRRYPLELWQNVEKSEYFIEGMENRSLIGEADHPQERLDYSVTEGAVVLTKYEIQNDGKVYTEFDILDTIPGRTVKTYFDAGCKLGVSSRGLGEEVMRDGEKIIDPDTYQFYCFDVVAFPAVKSARMELIESTSPKKQKLINSITSEIKNCKSLDEVRFIESMSKGVNLYLDEIREAIEIKREELDENKKSFSIAQCDNPEEAAKATKDLLDEFEKIGEINRTDKDKQFIEYLKNQLAEYASTKNESVDNESDDTKTKELAKSIVDKIDKKETKTKEDSQLSDFLKAWLGESTQSIEELFNQLKEEIDKNKTSSKNNKIKISGPKNISDEDTPEVVDRQPDDDLEILAELQEEVKTKNSNINSLNKQLEQKTAVIRNLLAKVHTQTESLQDKTHLVNELESIKQVNETLNSEKSSLSKQLQEKIDELSRLIKKYENLQKANGEFSKMLESLNVKYVKLNDENSSLIEQIKSLNDNTTNLKNTNIKLQESLDSNENIQKKVTTLTENINTLTNENKLIKKTNQNQKIQIEKLTTKNSELTNQNNELKQKYSQSLDKYIEAICLKFNIKESTLRRLLGENYSMKEIDNIALELVENMSKMNSLPFMNVVPEKRIVYENVGLTESVNNDNSTEEELNRFDFMLNSKNN